MCAKNRRLVPRRCRRVEGWCPHQHTGCGAPPPRATARRQGMVRSLSCGAVLLGGAQGHDHGFAVVRLTLHAQASCAAAADGRQSLHRTGNPGLWVHGGGQEMVCCIFPRIGAGPGSIRAGPASRRTSNACTKLVSSAKEKTPDLGVLRDQAALDRQASYVRSRVPCPPSAMTPEEDDATDSWRERPSCDPCVRSALRLAFSNRSPQADELATATTAPNAEQLLPNMVAAMDCSFAVSRGRWRGSVGVWLQWVGPLPS